MMKKLVAVICAVMLVMTAMISVYAADGEAFGDFIVSGDSGNCSYSGGVLTISGGTNITISTPNNSEDSPTTDRIVVDSPNGANITLSGVYIDRKGVYGGGAAFDITGGGPVTVTLDGDNFLQSGSGYAGLQNNEVSLTISGSGKLKAYGGSDAAGIGGGNRQNGSNITIKSGEIIAISDYDQHNDNTHSGGGAGIGGGNGGIGSNITIYDGKIRAEGNQGAGIGGGYNGKGSGITINGGEINAKSNAGGAGIGGGYFGSGIDITINGGNIRAEGPSTTSAGIGGGTSGDATNIIITGCEKIYAEGGLSGGPGIGGNNVTGIKISGGSDIEAKGGLNGPGAGIGGSATNASVTGIEISGGTIKAKSQLGAGIGGGNQKTGITISGGEIEATGGSTGIGSRSGTTTVEISGEDTEVTAESTNGAGITGSNITISNGDVTANGNTGIGGSDITISGGKVTATGTGGAGIGGTGSTVNINDETTCPLVYTNKIESTNGNSNYCGIVFDKAHKNTYTEPVDDKGNTYPADGVVYGNVTLTKTLTVEDGKLLRVNNGASLTTNGKLTLGAGSTLYLEENANLDTYKNIIINGEGASKGKILHEHQSSYDSDGVCEYCGSKLDDTHNLSDEEWQSDDNQHWHNCQGGDKDCSISHNDLNNCPQPGPTKVNLGDHTYGEPEADAADGKTYETCTVCGYRRLYVAPKPPAPPAPPEEPSEPTATTPPTETTVPDVTTEPTVTTVPTVTTIPSGGGNRPSYNPVVTTTTTTAAHTAEVIYPDESGEDISVEAGCYEDDKDGINVIPPIILIVITAASAFVLYRREKK